MAGAEAVFAEAGAAGLRCEGVISTSFGCPYEGDVDPGRVLEIAATLAAAGAAEIGFGDTTGMANPVQVRDFFERARAELPGVELTAHFHNTRGQGLANVLAALDAGCESFESSFGELGGCPFPPGATGNIATEDLVSMLHEMGIETGIDLEKLLLAAREAQKVLGRPLGSHTLLAGPVDHRRRATARRRVATAGPRSRASVFERVLIANRGEIAVRIERTLARLGIESVAVFSDADAGAPHVRGADRAVHIGPTPARESYLSIERVLDAAARSGADAIHPGYGFLSERPDFAAACAEAGIAFVGPGPEAMALLGDKARARAVAAEAGVPTLAGLERRGPERRGDRRARRRGRPAAAGEGGGGRRRQGDAPGRPGARTWPRRSARRGARRRRPSATSAC